MAAALIVLGYFIGALPTGLILVRVLRGEDIRKYGSGNIGAVNVLRVAGPGVAAAVLPVDVLKGLVPVLLALRAGVAPWAVVAAGLAAIAGHNWSVFLGFRGGKGIATSFGVLAGLSLHAALVAAVVWIIAVAISRFSSLGSLLAAVSVPISLWRLRTPPGIPGVRHHRAAVRDLPAPRQHPAPRRRHGTADYGPGRETVVPDRAQVLVYGAGAVGSLVAAALGESRTAPRPRSPCSATVPTSRPYARGASSLTRRAGARCARTWIQS